MAGRAQIATKRKEASVQISNLVRPLALGVLAIAWLILSGDKDAPQVVRAIPKWEAMGIAALCIAALFLDFIQYVAAYRQLGADLERADKADKRSGTKLTNHKYRQSSLRKWAFRGKAVVAGLAALWLVGVLAWAVTFGKGQPQKSSNEEGPTIIILLPSGQEIL